MSAISERVGRDTWRRAAVVLALVALAGARGMAGPARARPAEQAGQPVRIVDFAYQPDILTVSAGTMVTWTNSGRAPHTTTADAGAWDSGILSAGQSFSFTFDTPGTFTYHCDVHPFMTGTIVVQAAPSPAPAPTVTPAPAVGSEPVRLAASCNNVSLTWADGTPVSAVADAVTPGGGLKAIWRFDNQNQRFEAYSPEFPLASDLTTVNRLDAIFICMNTPGTLLRPLP